MTLSDVDTKVSELTKADTTAYPNANRLINLNIWTQKVVTIILDSQDSSDFDDRNRSGYSILNQSLVANQRDYSFGISDGIVEIKRVEISYDGVNLYRATPLDTSQINVGIFDENTTTVDTYFNESEPYYEWKNNALFLYPKPTESVGTVYVEASRVAKDFSLSDYTTGTATLGFDLNFHPMVAYGMSFDFFVSNSMTEQAQNMQSIISDYELRLRRQYGRKNREYPMSFQSEYVDYN